MEALQIEIDLKDVFHGDSMAVVVTVRDASGTLTAYTEPLTGQLYLIDPNTAERVPVMDVEACLVMENSSPYTPWAMKEKNRYQDNLQEAERGARETTLLPGVFQATIDTSKITVDCLPQRCVIVFSVPSGMGSVNAQRIFRLKDPTAEDQE